MEANPDRWAQPPGALYEPTVRVLTPRGDAAVELMIGEAFVRTGEPVLFRLVNRGETTLMAGQPFRVERWNGHDWRQIRWPSRFISTDEGWLLRPGQHSEHQRWPHRGASPAAPGWHRIVKSAWYEDPGGPRQEVVARARFHVTARRTDLKKAIEDHPSDGPQL